MVVPAKNCVLIIQPGRGHQGDEELRAVRVGASIRHTQGVRPGVRKRRQLQPVL